MKQLLNVIAVIHSNGCRFWYQNGDRHRDDGPAIIWHDGSQAWCLNDKQVTQEEVEG